MSVEPLLERGELHTLMVASAQSEEGTTTVAVELARLLTANAERRTLLVDANLQHPRLHAQFYCPQDPGLIQVLRGEVDLDEALQETPAERLWVLPVGRTMNRPADLITSSHVQRFMQAVRAEFDLTILDTPPLARTGEGLVFSSYADGVLLVVLAAVTQGPDLRNAVQSLRRAQGHLLGVVINNQRGEFVT
jgi:capsular exopolysaccharide synthesis family protein